MTTSLTPTYDALRARTDADIAADRARGGLHPATVARMRILSKAITSGQRAGTTAANNVWRPFQYEPFGSYDAGEVQRRAQEAARTASARARERYVVKAGI